jgi:translocator assembly and maintenance protein 41
MNQFYSSIIKKFPCENIKYAFAYGSGVFTQLNNNAAATKDKGKSSNMIDFVFVVNNSIKFHTENLKMNKSHYSFLKCIGPYYISIFQDNIPASCYYNTLIPIKLEDNSVQLIKYGVISEKMLIQDLYDWDYLYIRYIDNLHIYIIL